MPAESSRELTAYPVPTPRPVDSANKSDPPLHLLRMKRDLFLDGPIDTL